MTSLQLEDYYTSAIKALPKRSAVMVIELVEEVRRLRELRTKSKVLKGEDLDDDCEVTFGEYKGERLGDIPDDYLIVWRSENPLGAILGKGKSKKEEGKSVKLRLYEYICKRVRTETKEFQGVLPLSSVIDRPSGVPSERKSP